MGKCVLFVCFCFFVFVLLLLFFVVDITVNKMCQVHHKTNNKYINTVTAIILNIHRHNTHTCM